MIPAGSLHSGRQAGLNLAALQQAAEAAAGGGGPGSGGGASGKRTSSTLSYQMSSNFSFHQADPLWRGPRGEEPLASGGASAASLPTRRLHVPDEPSGDPLHRGSWASSSARTVLRIFGTGAARSYLEPWKVLGQNEWTGSGFAVTVGKEKLVLTNAHVVDNASLLRVSRHGESKKHPARLVCIAHDIDLALLEVLDKSNLLEEVPVATFKEVLPRLYSEVKVVGFPQGGSTICVTKGVVSRIDAQEYVHPLLKGVCTNKVLIIQIDAAINPGNSGGPAFDPASGMAIGVASSGMPGAQNIGYIIPASIALNFLTEYARSRAWPGLPEAGFHYRGLENEALRRYLGLGPDQTGVEVHSVAPRGALAGKLLPGDVLLTVGDYEVSSEGTVSYEVHDEKVNLSLEFLLTRDLPGASKRLSVLREGKVQEIATTFGPIPALVGRFDRVDCQPTYFIVGGYVFCPLSFPMIHQDREVPESLVERAYSSWRQADEQIIVQQRGLKHRINEGYDLDSVRPLVTVQGEKVVSMEGLLRSVGGAIAGGAEYLAFGFDSAGGLQKEVLPVAELAEADSDILELHQIPACVSPNLLELYRSVMPSSSCGVLSTLMKIVRCGRNPSPEGNLKAEV